MSGDRHASLVTPDEVRNLVLEVFPDAVARETPLMERDHPNYCFVFETAGDRALSQ